MKQKIIKPNAVSNSAPELTPEQLKRLADYNAWAWDKMMSFLPADMEVKKCSNPQA